MLIAKLLRATLAVVALCSCERRRHIEYERITGIGIGDVNKDGYCDLAFGIVGASVNGIRAGTVQVRSGNTLQLLYNVKGPDKYFGKVMIPISDCNDDGISDLAVAAGYSEGQGPVTVVSGTNGKLICRLSEPFGASLAFVQDQTGTRPARLIVGRPRRLSVAAYCPLTGQPDFTWAFEGDRSRILVGYEISAGGDFDGDQFEDIIAVTEVNHIRNKNHTGAGVKRGSIRVLSGVSGQCIDEIIAPREGTFFCKARTAGDVDLDGIPEILAAVDDLAESWIGLYSGATRQLITKWNTGGSVEDIEILSTKYCILTSGPREAYICDISSGQFVSTITYRNENANYSPLRVEMVGDVNADMTVDFAIMPYAYSEYGSTPIYPGVVEIYSGSTYTIIHQFPQEVH